MMGGLPLLGLYSLIFSLRFRYIDAFTVTFWTFVGIGAYGDDVPVRFYQYRYGYGINPGCGCAAHRLFLMAARLC